MYSKRWVIILDKSDDSLSAMSCSAFNLNREQRKVYIT